MALDIKRELNGVDRKIYDFYDNLTDQEKKEFIVRDNTHSGMWDFDMLANEGWELTDLDDWGVDINFLVPTRDEPKQIDNTKKGKVCPHCNLPL